MILIVNEVFLFSTNNIEMEVFGFYSDEARLLDDVDKHFDRIHVKIQNGLNFIGWFPLIGSLTGLFRLGGTIILHSTDGNEVMHISYYIMSGIRSGVEICSAGCIFIIPDLMATLARKYKINKLKKSKNFKK